jgi:hypothetical protein
MTLRTVPALLAALALAGCPVRVIAVCAVLAITYVPGLALLGAP